MMPYRAEFVLIALGATSLLAPLLVRRGRGLPIFAWRMLAIVLCILPMTAPLACRSADHPGFTLAIAVFGVIVTLKAIDWLANPRCEDQPLRVGLALSIWPGLQIEDVAVRIDVPHERFSLATEKLASGAAGIAIGLALAGAGQWLDLPARGIWLDSWLKALEICGLVGGANDLMVGAFALAGYRATDAFRYPILAHSVLDFWSRYNVWIHRWLKHHVFEPIGWRGRHPILAILAVFAASGLFHEYLIVVARPELIGRQFAFFGLHGLGAVGGTWLGRRYRAIAGRRAQRALAIATTIGFVLLALPIFIGCLDHFIDLHRDVGSVVLSAVLPGR